MSRWNCTEQGEGEEEEEEEGPVQGASEMFCDARKHSTRGEEGGEARRMLHRIETLAPPSLTTSIASCTSAGALCGSHRGGPPISTYFEPFSGRNLKIN